MPFSQLEVRDLGVRLGGRSVLDGITLSVAAGEVFALLGPSGCGKSTLLATIAGLRQHTGEINWEGRPLSGVPVERRGFGLMFQEYALFPHMNVFANLAFGPRMAGIGRDAVAHKVAEVAQLAGVTPLLQRPVDSLSGGERQRVALARALAPSPTLVMLDEPLGSLDRPLRERLIEELPALLRQQRQTVIYVTHDLDEAFSVADRVAVMSPGQIQQVGTPVQLLESPATRFVADFLGVHTLVPGIVAAIGGRLVARTPLGPANVPAVTTLPPGTRVLLALRKDIAVLPGPGVTAVSATLVRTAFRGGRQELHLRCGDLPLTLYAPIGFATVKPGQDLSLGVDLGQAAVVETESL